MNTKWQARIIAVAFVTMALFGLFSLLRGGFRLWAIARAFALFCPLITVGFVVVHRNLPGIVIGCVVLTVTLQMPVLYRIEGGMIVAGVVCALAVARVAIRHGGRRIISGVDGYCMLLTALIVCGRFLYDRPGSARMGGTGGGGEAALFVMAVLAYFGVALITADRWSPKTNLSATVVLVVCICAYSTATSVAHRGMGALPTLFNRQYWFLLSLLLAWSFYYETVGERLWLRAVLSYGVIGVILLMGICSPHRSRPLFAAGIVGSVAYVYRRFRRAALIFAGCGVLAVSVVLIARSGQLPARMMRTLSTVLPTDASEIRWHKGEDKVSSEVGWQSEFRGELYGMALQHIKAHPVLGKGFAFTRDEILAAIGARRHSGKRFRSLDLSGCYHNSVLQLAVACGVPCALLFLVAYGTGIVRFLRAVRKMRDPYLVILSAGMVGLFAAQSGQMFMNGGGRDIFAICVLLGAMKGICAREDIRRQRDEILDSNAEPQ
jgi:hypothetical protein